MKQARHKAVHIHRAAIKRMVVAPIGRTASERMRSHGWPVDLEPFHHKMGVLVKEVSEAAWRLLQGKRPA